MTNKKFGDYCLLEKLGAGGMGEVWLGHNIHTKLTFAIKLLPEDLASDPRFVARFFDEGRVMQTLDHPHIVRVHHVGCNKATGQYYLVMNFIEGPKPDQPTSETGKSSQVVTNTSCSLQNLVTQSKNQQLPEKDLRKWLKQIAEALAYAHAHGVVHRDIKPANILIDQAGNAHITDFGLAKAIGEDYLRNEIQKSIQRSMIGNSVNEMPTIAGKDAIPDTLHQQATGADPSTAAASAALRMQADALLGTYDYMAPEQRGDVPNAKISPASDIYSLGVMMYRLLTGRRPVGLLKPASVIVEGLPAWWDTIVNKCLEHDPADRFANGAELLAAVAPLHPEQTTPIATPPQKSTDSALPQGKIASRSGKISSFQKWTAILLILIATGTFFAAFFYTKQQIPPEAEQTEQISNLLEKQRAAEAARSAAEEARRLASGDRAETDADHLWERADNAYSAGKGAFNLDHFELAAINWQEATSLFLDAQQRAVAMQAYRNARNAYEATVLPNKKLLDLHGASAWQETQRLARIGYRSDDINYVDPEEGRKAFEQASTTLPNALEEARQREHNAHMQTALDDAYNAQTKKNWHEVISAADRLLTLHPNHAEAQSLKHEAQASLIPKWRIVATVDGNSVAATIRIKNEQKTSPHTFTLQKGRNYSGEIKYESQAQYYYRKIDTLNADWEGEREQHMELQELALPFKGKDWISPTTGMPFVWINQLQLWVGKYEVTNDEYRKMMPSHDSGSRGRHSLNAPKNPAVNLTFQEIAEFAEWMSLQDQLFLGNMAYRLPNSSEWEAFASTGNKQDYPWGRGFPPLSGEAGNYFDMAAYRAWREQGVHGRYEDRFAVSAPVDKSWRNAWGLYGVGGNVWEATADYAAGRIAFGGWRGGSWLTSDKGDLRITAVLQDQNRREDCGFRLVISPPR